VGPFVLLWSFTALTIAVLKVFVGFDDELEDDSGGFGFSGGLPF